MGKRAATGRTLRISGAVLAVALATPASSQNAEPNTGSVGDYRLPDPTRTQAPRPQGPVDPDNPYSLPSRPPRVEPTPVPTPAATPTPTPAPRIVLPAPTTPTPRPTTSASPRVREEEPVTSPPRVATTPGPAVTASAAPTPDIPSPQPESSAAPASEIPAPATAGETGWLIPAALAILALAIGAFLLLRRRRPAAPEEPDISAQADIAPQPSPPVLARAPAAKAPVPAPAASTAAPSLDEPLPLAITFAAQAVRLSLVYATLQYALDVTNAGAQALPPLEVRADLASAHASIGTREQLAPEPSQLEAKHAVPALAPGETVTLKGEVRLGLQQIVPLTKGAARFFVPLVRFCVLAPEGQGVRRVFTVGPRAPDSAAPGTMASVRLDAGPRNLRELDAREIEGARGFALDPVVAQG